MQQEKLGLSIIIKKVIIELIIIIIGMQMLLILLRQQTRGLCEEDFSIMEFLQGNLQLLKKEG